MSLARTSSKVILSCFLTWGLPENAPGWQCTHYVDETRVFEIWIGAGNFHGIILIFFSQPFIWLVRWTNWKFQMILREKMLIWCASTLLLDKLKASNGSNFAYSFFMYLEEFSRLVWSPSLTWHGSTLMDGNIWSIAAVEWEWVW